MCSSVNTTQWKRTSTLCANAAATAQALSFMSLYIFLKNGVAYHDFLQVNMSHKGIVPDADSFPFTQW